VSGRPVGILLAAGASARFGADKLLHPLADGVPIGLASARTLRGARGRVIAVVRRGDGALAALLAGAGVEVTVCPDAHRGLGRSLAWGVGQAADAPGWVVALADMPYLRPETVARVGEAIAGGALLAAPFYRGRRGHPVGFAPALAAELLALAGDRGGREVIDRHRAALVALECDDPGVLRDVDTPTATSPAGAAGPAGG
jgi:molybdenum cofactor cytidylyltransferase